LGEVTAETLKFDAEATQGADWTANVMLAASDGPSPMGCTLSAGKKMVILAGGTWRIIHGSFELIRFGVSE
jgi:hypothetical protein